MIKLVTNLKRRNFHVISEGKLTYTMPFILKHILDKHLALLGDEHCDLPVAQWYLKLSEERKHLVEIK
jgi:hypothetical protein